MSKYVYARILEGFITLFFASILIFGSSRLTGDPLYIILPENATKQDHEAMAKHLGLDRPIYEQYWRFITHLVRGDWGKSIVYRRPVMEIILERFPATLKLGLAATVISFSIALVAGVIAAVKRERWQDIMAKGFAILGQSMPTFWLGILSIQVFAVWLGWFPAGGYGDGTTIYWILPAFCMGFHATAGVLRLTRSSMLDILNSDYVRLARIKGVSERLVVWKHALRNAFIPVVTFGGVVFAHMLMGSVITETIFSWPGIGRLAFQSIKTHDFPLMQGVLTIFIGLFVVLSLAIDILYCYLDPRVRYSKE
jgi:peptide/nickel transport system permease protein